MTVADKQTGRQTDGGRGEKESSIILKERQGEEEAMGRGGRGVIKE